MLQAIAIMLIVLMINGCSVFESKPQIEESKEESPLVCKIPYDFNYPQGVQWKRTKFYVLNPKIMRDIIDNGNPNDLPEVYFALSIDGYENLGYNMNEIIRVLQSQKALLKGIKMYYTKDSEPQNSDSEE